MTSMPTFSGDHFYVKVVEHEELHVFGQHSNKK